MSIQVISPDYYTDIADARDIILFSDTPIGSISAYTVNSVDGRAAQVFLGTILPDPAGFYLLHFDPKSFPHGPIVLRFEGGEGKLHDLCQLMLYNTAGFPFREGLASAPKPCWADGMELVFADDFDSPDLSIAKNSSGRYYSHKPGGGDFSKLPFSDYESAVNPFFQRDSYLLIRADAEKNSSGLISSIKPDGSGFSIKAPCYFECRFLGPKAIGTWPAFWLMTKGVAGGLSVPADELDTIEAYGVEDLSHQNQVGYYVTSHRWNQKIHETTDSDRFIDMRTLGDGTGWDHTFHTYGTLITPEETVYTCDNIEVFRHPTQPISKTEDFFFMINLAVGGNGWPVDLSRYNGMADMYVDFVRVYAAE